MLAEIFGFGWIGVDLFFALSGFLITDILLENVSTEDYFGRFYLRRAFRIFPVYYFFLFCFFHVGPLVSRVPGLQLLTRGRGEEWWYWAYLYNWSPFAARNRSIAHLWSLCVEEQFYLFWPLVVRYTSRSSLKLVCIAVAFVSPLLRLVAAASSVSPVRIYGETIFRLDGLAMGALLAIAARDRELERRVVAWSKPLLAGAGIVIVGILCREGSYFQGRAMLTWGGSALATLSAAAVFYCRRIGGVLRSQFLRSFGKYSYAIYVWHYPLVERTRIELLKLNGNISPLGNWTLFGGALILGIGVSWAIGWASWRLIELPSMRVRDRLTNRQSTEYMLARTASAV
jgi:peptidoglycan/LPS O-acetylase OafA/YrhL